MTLPQQDEWNQQVFKQKLDYIHNNPMEAGLYEYLINIDILQHLFILEKKMNGNFYLIIRMMGEVVGEEHQPRRKGWEIRALQLGLLPNSKTNVQVTNKRLTAYYQQGLMHNDGMLPKCQLPAHLLANPLCVSSEAVNEMRVGLSMGGAERPPPSNRLHAALL